MSEQAPETTDEPQADEATPEGTAGAAEDVGTDGLDPAEDADGQPDAPVVGHVSHVSDLPEGAEVDKLTDARPVPVVESETHDG